MQWNRVITAYDVHAEGETGRVVTGGIVPPPGNSVYEKMCHMRENNDWIRKFLLNEPRGGNTSSANILVPPCDPRASVGYIIIETAEYCAMSGSNTICTATAALEAGIVPMTGDVTKFGMEAPGGLIEITADTRGGRAREIEFRNQPAFVCHLDAPIQVEGLGEVVVDVAYGGMFFVIADAEKLGFSIQPEEGKALVDLGMRLVRAAAEQLESVHPENPGLHTVSIACLAMPVKDGPDGKTSRNACIVQPGRIDRCPTGTATCARLAVMHARDRIAVGETFTNHSILDTRFRSRIVETTTCGGVPAVIPTVAGRGFVTGMMTYGLDPNDPFPEGYRIPD
jgi:proline racemase